MVGNNKEKNTNTKKVGRNKGELGIQGGSGKPAVVATKTVGVTNKPSSQTKQAGRVVGSQIRIQIPNEEELQRIKQGLTQSNQVNAGLSLNPSHRLLAQTSLSSPPQMTTTNAIQKPPQEAQDLVNDSSDEESEADEVPPKMPENDDRMDGTDIIPDNAENDEEHLAQDDVVNDQQPILQCGCRPVVDEVLRTVAGNALILQELLARQRNVVAGAANENMPRQPFNDVASLLEFDDKLKANAELQAEFKAQIAYIGGTDYKKCVRNVMAYLMTNQLSALVSWAKTDHTTSLSESDVKFIPLIVEGIHEVPEFRGKASQHDIMKAIKDWMRRPGDRMKSVAKKRRLE